VAGSPFPGEPVNPFLHDRHKTFQPVDFFEGLLKLAILLFPLDVGIRRIQIDRQEWEKAVRAVRRRLFFWEGASRPVESEESLAALLARRDSVRARQTSPALTVSPELFRPQKPIEMTPPAGTERVPSVAAPVASPAPAEPVAPEPGTPLGTTDRLLAAKRRARRKME
jgi:uncharacterized membrane protein